MMKWTYFFVLQIILVLIVWGVINLHQDKAVIVKMPPESIAKWYKPESKRHVWLHNMFKLRREMQAVKLYAENKQDKNLAKWSASLNEHYLKIGDMVPEWQMKLDLTTLANIQGNVASQDYAGVIAEVERLQENCDSCHNDYQSITALLYRSPDFSQIEIEGGMTFTSHMQQLTGVVNQIKIAQEDDSTELALASLGDLKVGIDALGQVCTDCHKKDRKPYPSEQMQNTLASLEHNLVHGSKKEQAMDLGILAVQACATCHGTHRLAFDTKSLLTKEQTFAELMKH